MRLFYQLCLLSSFLLAAITSNSQANSGEAILAGLTKWQENNPQEKVFLQTNTERYAAGESIWFKTWCVLDNRPSFLSKIVYVTLSDASGKVIEKKMYYTDPLSTINGVI